MKLARALFVVGVILALPGIAHAQEAVVSGVVTDTTGGVLPGVTVTARHLATGNTFVAVTDVNGAFRLGVRTGVYEVMAELQGFATLTRSGLELLVGQQVVVNLQMSPAGLQESVTVTGEAPLIDVTSSTVAHMIRFQAAMITRS